MTGLKAFALRRAACTAKACALSSLLAVAACGGGGGGDLASASPPPAASPPSPPATGRVLPPDPGAAASATKLGIDSNANGVRDEVERALSAAFPEDTRFKAAMGAAQAYQRLLSEPPPSSRAAALAAFGRIACAAPEPLLVIGTDGSLLLQLTFDTEIRRAAYLQTADKTEGGYEASELPPCG